MCGPPRSCPDLYTCTRVYVCLCVNTRFERNVLQLKRAPSLFLEMVTAAIGKRRSQHVQGWLDLEPHRVLVSRGTRRVRARISIGSQGRFDNRILNFGSYIGGSRNSATPACRSTRFASPSSGAFLTIETECVNNT